MVTLGRLAPYRSVIIPGMKGKLMAPRRKNIWETKNGMLSKDIWDPPPVPTAVRAKLRACYYAQFAKTNGDHEFVAQVSTYVAIVGRPGRVCLLDVGEYYEENV